jgi:hypothetical protein
VIAGALAEEERDDDFRHRRRKNRTATVSSPGRPELAPPDARDSTTR